MTNYKLITLTVCTLVVFTPCVSGDDDTDSASIQDTSLVWECPDYGFTYDAEGFSGSLAVVLDSSGLSDEYKLFLATNRIFNWTDSPVRLGAAIKEDTVSVGFSGATSESQSQVTRPALGRRTYHASFSVGAARFYLRIFDDNNLYLVSATADSVSLRKLTGETVCISPTVEVVDH